MKNKFTYQKFWMRNTLAEIAKSASLEHPPPKRRVGVDRSQSVQSPVRQSLKSAIYLSLSYFLSYRPLSKSFSARATTVLRPFGLF